MEHLPPPLPGQRIVSTSARSVREARLEDGFKVLLFDQSWDVILYGQTITFLLKIRFQPLNIFPLELSGLLPLEMQPFEPDASHSFELHLSLRLNSQLFLLSTGRRHSEQTFQKMLVER